LTARARGQLSPCVEHPAFRSAKYRAQLTLPMPPELPPRQTGLDICLVVDADLPGAKMFATELLRMAVPWTGVQLGIAWYRDMWERPEKMAGVVQFESPPFERAHGFMHELAPPPGRHHRPTNAAAGLLAAVRHMAWSSPSKMMVHITDKPCHGPDFAPPSMQDGMPADCGVLEVMTRAAAMRIEYVGAFLSIGGREVGPKDCLQRMILRFAEVYAGRSRDGLTLLDASSAAEALRSLGDHVTRRLWAPFK
jgi:hypothetical protein